MTPIREFWDKFCIGGLQVQDARIVSRMWSTLLDSNVSNKQALLHSLSRIVDSAARDHPQALRHWFAKCSPKVLIELADRAVAHGRLKRREASYFQEQVLRQTRRDGTWNMNA